MVCSGARTDGQDVERDDTNRNGSKQMVLNKIKIRRRWETCRCGCKGRDHWHTNVIQRTVRDVRELSAGATARTTAEYGQQEVIREGFIRLPYGERVRVVQLRTGLTIDRDGAGAAWRLTHDWRIDADSDTAAQQAN